MWRWGGDDADESGALSRTLLLLLAHDLGVLNDENHRLLTEGVVEVKQMLSALIRRLKSKGLNSDS